jgi:hypothetical protein
MLEENASTEDTWIIGSPTSSGQPLYSLKKNLLTNISSSGNRFFTLLPLKVGFKIGLGAS